MTQLPASPPPRVAHFSLSFLHHTPFTQCHTYQHAARDEQAPFLLPLEQKWLGATEEKAVKLVSFLGGYLCTVSAICSLRAVTDPAPSSVSYLILASGWILFMFFITLGEVLIKRREIGRFLEQYVLIFSVTFCKLYNDAEYRVITFNTLFFLTVLSLITTSLRSPGSPDQTLAPTSSAPGFSLIRPRQGRKQHPSKNDHLSVHPAVEKSKPQSNIKIMPPPSLKFLRNPQWVSSRLHKDRPSPLPLFKNLPYPSVPSTPDSPSTDDSDSFESDETGWIDLDSESKSGSDYSPFPLSPSPRNNDRDDDVDNDGDEGEHVRLLIVEKGHAQTHDNMSRKADSSTSTSMPRMDTSITATGKTQSRWCKQCNAWKPDRTHHCRHCHRCVLKSEFILPHTYFSPIPPPLLSSHRY